MSNSDYPLTLEWERAAMKEVCDVAHLLAHGMFESPEELRDRLHNAADAIIQTEQIYSSTLPPSTRPEINAIGARFIAPPGRERIDYIILDDCRCSHCGKDAAVVPLPDGGTTISDRCGYCDQYNLEILAEAVE